MVDVRCNGYRVGHLFVLIGRAVQGRLFLFWMSGDQKIEANRVGRVFLTLPAFLPFILSLFYTCAIEYSPTPTQRFIRRSFE